MIFLSCGLEAGLVLDWGQDYGGKDILRLRAAKRKIAEMTEKPRCPGEQILAGDVREQVESKEVNDFVLCPLPYCVLTKTRVNLSFFSLL